MIKVCESLSFKKATFETKEEIERVEMMELDE
jgi:hypothetical protein